MCAMRWQAHNVNTIFLGRDLAVVYFLYEKSVRPAREPPDPPSLA
jgi:hypothetical protein